MNKRQTLLHVEEDDSLAQSFRRALVQEGFQYQRVASVEEAIAYIGNRGRYSDALRFPPPNAIVTDFALSDGKSAPEFIIWLRRHPQHEHIPIVLTVRSEGTTEERVMRAGANAFIIKGAGVTELVEQLRSVFRECGVM